MARVGGQSIAYVAKKQYLCRRIQVMRYASYREVRDGREMVAFAYAKTR